MTYYHHVFGAFEDKAPCPRERAFQDRLDQIGKEAAVKQANEITYLTALFDYEVMGIGSKPVMPATMLPKLFHSYRSGMPDPVPADFKTRIRTDEHGVVWDLHRPGSAPEAGDLIDDDGVWRPRKTASMCATRYDRAVFAHHESQKHLEAVILANGSDLQLKAARMKVEGAWEIRTKALAEADDPEMQERERIDAWRKGDGKDDYNASRRTRETPNAKLSGMTDEEKKAHKRTLDAARKKRKRDAEKAQIVTLDS